MRGVGQRCSFYHNTHQRPHPAASSASSTSSSNGSGSPPSSVHMGQLGKLHWTTVSQSQPKTRCSIKNVARISTNLNEVKPSVSEKSFFVITYFLPCVKILAHLIKYWLRYGSLSSMIEMIKMSFSRWVTNTLASHSVDPSTQSHFLWKNPILLLRQTQNCDWSQNFPKML